MEVSGFRIFVGVVIGFTVLCVLEALVQATLSAWGF